MRLPARDGIFATRRLHTFLIAGAIALLPGRAFAQTAASTQSSGTSTSETSLATRPGHDVQFGVGAYDYVEPGDTSISIHGPKLSGGYTGVWQLNPRRQWFLTIDARGVAGNTTYDGFCAPYLIVPDSRSPNGYALDIGDYSPCSESGDEDWYVEGRTLVGKDFVGRAWGWSPAIGLGVRHLSNGVTGVSGYRTDEYLYLPVRLTARTRVASRRLLSVTLEYDHLLHGWQTTRQSQLGGGTGPATPTAPAFIVHGFTDVSFEQHSGWALRASVRYELTTKWSVGPEYTHWNVSDSTVSTSGVTFTVNGITAQQLVGFLEPLNTTDEFVVTLGFRF